MHEDNEDYRSELSIGDVESRVGLSFSYHFGFRILQHDLFTESQWTSIQEILERFYGLPDLPTALEYAADRRNDGLGRRVDPPIENRDEEPDEIEELLRPFGSAYAALPNNYLSILEAAYEHSNNTKGLLHIYSYYILIDCTNYELYYQLLRSLAADDWLSVRDDIITLFNQFNSRIFGMKRNLAYEYLLAQEQLVEPAWRYLQERLDINKTNEAFFSGEDLFRSLLLDLAPIIAQGHCEEVAVMIAQPLRDADSDLLAFDTAENRLEIAKIFQQLLNIGSVEHAEMERNRLKIMYPLRFELQTILEAVIEGKFNEYDPKWKESSTR